jgi:hypothetical protein
LVVAESSSSNFEFVDSEPFGSGNARFGFERRGPFGGK